MAITPENTADVLRLYRANPRRFSPFKVARQVGLSTEEVFNIIEDNRETLSTAKERFGGFGRPELQPFIVARRRAMDREWDNNDPEIVKARTNLETGTHIMTTGRDGAWLVLYSIPRKGRPDPQPGYFLPEVA